MSEKWHKAELPVRGPHEAEAVPIVSDAAIATEPVADGRLIPLLILDTSQRPDIEQLIDAHAHTGPGDVETQWGRDGEKGELESVRLLCTFKRPVPCLLFFDFELPRQGSLVDLVISARALYLQSGRPGQRLVGTQDAPRILVEVHVEQFAPEWERIYTKGIEKEFRKAGLGRAQARSAVKEYLGQTRSLHALARRRPQGS